jgi:hypothetical protein
MAPIPAVLTATIMLSVVPAWLAAQPAQRDEHRPWSRAHVVLAASFAMALWIDAAQTRNAMERGYREANPILGPHPSSGQINAYSVIAGLTVIGVAAAVPPRVRPWLLAAAFAVEAVTIAGTVRQGIAITF